MNTFWAVLGLTFCLLFGTVTLHPVLAQQSGGDDDEEGPGNGQGNGGGNDDDDSSVPSFFLTVILEEVIAIGDILSPVPAHTASEDRSLDDLVGIIDQVLPSPSSSNSLRQINDSVSLSDSMVWQAEMSEELAVDISDAVNLRDQLYSSPQITTNIPRAITDSIGVSDSAQRNFVQGNVNPPQTQPPAQTPALTPVERNPPPRANAARFLIETLEVNDAPDQGGSLTAAPESALRVVDNIAVSGLVVPPSAPIVSITSPVIELPRDGTAEITFHSTSTGTYEIEILDKDGKTVRSLEGGMKLGANSVAWDGRGSSDAMSPAGRYIYYISAEGNGGSREPPRNGDGVIVIAGTSAAGPTAGVQFDPAYLIVVAIIAAAGAGLFFFLRRQGSLVMYLPAAASEVIDDIRERYPDLVVEDYVDPNDPTLLKGVTINNPKGADEQWLTDMAEKAKNIAGVDSVNINYRGKQQTL